MKKTYQQVLAEAASWLTLLDENDPVTPATPSQIPQPTPEESQVPQQLPQAGSPTASGTPTWLFQLPGLAATRQRLANKAARAFLTMVLPLLPVTATSLGMARWRCQPASLCSAARGSSTSS